MWIRQLDVQHFSGIRSASIAFGPGLNVLHGRNELGKSSLVHAIRAALLLPDSSSARKEFEDWHVDQPPRVTLVFETEPGRIWKVRKSFGSGSNGWSYLEFSKDGETFGQEAKGREVDGRLRALLSWGIEGPGGRTRTRGLPDSFLATALLGEQNDVESVLRRGLDEDREESGKQRLTEALQALAEDPVFRKVVEAAQARMDEAFTATGRKRSGRGSPWIELRDRRRQVDERKADARAQAEKSRAAEKRVAELQEQLDRALERLDERAAKLDAAETAWQAQEARRAAQEKVDRARAEHERIAGLNKEVAKMAADLREREKELTAAKDLCAAAESRLADERQALERARERLRDLERGDAEQERRLGMERIERALIELEAQETAARSRAERAVGVRELEEQAEAGREEQRKRREELTAAKEKLAEAERTLEHDAGALRSVEEQARVLSLGTARRALARAEEKAAEVAAQRALAAESRARARRILKELAAAERPDDKEMRTLEDLERELHVVEAALEVGLSVTVRPTRELSVGVAVDEVEGEPAGGDVREVAAGNETTVEARRTVRLSLEGLADVEVSGGGPERRAEANRLRGELSTKVRELLDRADVDNLEKLREVVGAAASREKEAEKLAARAKEIDAWLEGAGGVDLQRETAVKEASLAERRVVAALEGGEDLAAVLLRWDDGEGLDEEEIARSRLRVGEAVESHEHRVHDLEQKTGAWTAVLESKASALAALEKEAQDAAEALGGDWKTVLEEAGREAELAVRTRAEKRAELERLQVGDTAEVDRAREEVDAREAAFARAGTELDAAQESERGSLERVGELQGALRTRRDAAEREDLPAAEEALREAMIELESAPDPSSPVTEEKLVELREAVERLRTDHRALLSERQKAQGALEEVGGQYAEERLRQVDDSLRALEERERETELEYGAWQLLLDVAKDSEREDAMHLGKALVEPVAKRMSALTGGRHERLGIGPELRADGVEVAGESRELSSLSVGTRDQFATVLRLTIADALESVLVLDDQLVQSDLQRMLCLAAFIAECAKKFQILVFTCRPEEYVSGDEDSARTMDLEEIVRRTDPLRPDAEGT